MSGPRPCCRDVLDRLAEWLDRALDAEAADGVERHLAGCDGCADYLASYLAALALARDAWRSEGPDAALPDSFVGELAAMRLPT